MDTLQNWFNTEFHWWFSVKNSWKNTRAPPEKHQFPKCQMHYSLVTLYDYESNKSHSKHLELSFIQSSVAKQQEQQQQQSPS